MVGDTFLIVIANNSKCNAVLKFKQSLPLQKGFSFCPSDKNDKTWLDFRTFTTCIPSAISCENWAIVRSFPDFEIRFAVAFFNSQFV